MMRAIVLAAGEGTRMKSRKAKVVHAVAGRPMIVYTLETLTALGVHRPVVIVGHRQEDVRAALAGWDVEFVEQDFRTGKGTGHAVLQAKEAFTGFTGDVLVLVGDAPLLRVGELMALARAHQENSAAATILTAHVSDPSGYGRVLRDRDGSVAGIVEEKDATPEQRAVNEINTGIYCFAAPLLFKALDEVGCDNAQGEYYLTDVIAVLRGKGQRVAARVTPYPEEALGINSRLQLAEATATLFERKRRELMDAGVTIEDPASTYIEPGVAVAADTIIRPQTFLEGKTSVGSGCVLGPGCRIIDCDIGNNVSAQYSVLWSARVGDDVTIGPFAYLRPGTEVAEGAKIGDFVEIKNSSIGAGSKVPHHSYIGDTIMGRGVNIGAGTITCNYDGFRKHRTVIEDDVFIGANNNLVAPVKVGAGAYTATGSTITKEVPPGALAIARARQENKEGWAAKRRQKQEG